MRQTAETTPEQKLEDVDKILELLELDTISDALVGSLGVEERKRVTIGVELCARPSALLFLDEVRYLFSTSFLGLTRDLN